MKHLIYLLIALTLVGCGKKQKKEFRVDPALMPYYDAFVVEASKRGRAVATDDLIMEFGTMPPSDNGGQVIGVCYQGEKTSYGVFKQEVVKTPRIVINPTHFRGRTTTNDNRQDLLFHEMGHCLMNLDHDSRTISYQGRTYPESIMYPFSISMVLQSGEYSKYRLNYFDQLFGVVALAFSDGAAFTATASTNMNASTIPETIVYAEPNEIQQTVYISTLSGCDEHVEIKVDSQPPESEEQASEVVEN